MAAGPTPARALPRWAARTPASSPRRGDLERAATGIVRSAFGLTGQKCSALSRVYVEEAAADALLAKVLEKTAGLRVGDPCLRENWMGPVVNEAAAEAYVRYCARLRRAAAGSSPAARVSATATSPTATSWPRPWPRPRPTTPSSARRCSSPS